VGEKGFFPSINNSSQLYLAKWLDDTPIYYDALEIVAEKARRFWWGQQIDLATVSWSLLLVLEGRRRRIPLLPAFLALAHVVNLSYAQNLFYLALLFNPSVIAPRDDVLELPLSPIPASTWTRFRDRLLPRPKPSSWHPHPGILIGTIFIDLGAIYVLPYAAERPSFSTIVLIARACTFLPLILARLIPVTWGSNSHPQHVYRRYFKPATIFRVLSLGSFALHAQATILALIYNAPDAHHHRHSHLWPWDAEQRSIWERSTTALGKVLGSTADHPVVAGVGGDTLLCALSLGLWAAVRAVDAREIISCAIPFYSYKADCTRPTPSSKHLSDEFGDLSLEDEDEEVDQIETRERERERVMDITPPGTPNHPGSPEHRGASVISSSGSSILGEETPTRRKGWPHRETFVEDQAEEEEEQGDDDAYESALDGECDIVMGDSMSHEELDWENAALSWGLIVMGGLGSACAGVFGAEYSSS
jgi:hypothetical protein